jgi:hypothetical protein
MNASQTRQHRNFIAGGRFRLLPADNIYASLLAGQPAARIAVLVSSIKGRMCQDLISHERVWLRVMEY